MRCYWWMSVGKVTVEDANVVEVVAGDLGRELNWNKNYCLQKLENDCNRGSQHNGSCVILILGINISYGFIKFIWSMEV